MYSDEQIQKIVLEVLQNYFSMNTNQDVSKQTIWIVTQQTDSEIDYEKLFEEVPFRIQKVQPDELRIKLDEIEKDYIIIETLTRETIAKIVLGLEDQSEAKFIAACIVRDYPFYIIKEGIEDFGRNKAYQLLFTSYERQLKELGARIFSIKDIAKKFKPKKSSILTLEDVKTLNPQNKNYHLPMTSLAKDWIKEQNM